jgi:hypothetical protein
LGLGLLGKEKTRRILSDVAGLSNCSGRSEMGYKKSSSRNPPNRRIEQPERLQFIGKPPEWSIVLFSKSVQIRSACSINRRTVDKQHFGFMRIPTAIKMHVTFIFGFARSTAA